MGTCRIAPGPSITPMPLMSAAEVPSAGHETAPSCWLGVAVPARGVTVPEGDAAGPEGDVFSSPVVQPFRQTSTATNARTPLCRR
jgi:hypothetical protein